MQDWRGKGDHQGVDKAKSKGEFYARVQGGKGFKGSTNHGGGKGKRNNSTKHPNEKAKGSFQGLNRCAPKLNEKAEWVLRDSRRIFGKTLRKGFSANS